LTAREAIDSFRSQYPSSVGEDVLISWISELEGTIVGEIVMTHEGAPDGASSFGGITLVDGADIELSAKEPYSKVYVDYLRMKCDVYHNDTARYETSSALFSASYADFADHYNRRHAPLCAATQLKTKSGDVL